MNTSIVNGWLKAGDHRVLLSKVERYEKRGAKVLLYGLNWAHAVDMAGENEPEAAASALLATLDGYFAPAQS